MGAMGAMSWTWIWAGGPAVVDVESSRLLERLVAPELLWELVLLRVPRRLLASRFKIDIGTS